MLKSRWLLPIVLLAMALMIVAMRCRTYSEPLENDITIYAVIGHELVHGRPLYADLWDFKPPAVFVTFAMGELLTGYGMRQIFLLNIFAAVASLLGIYATSRVATGSRKAGLMAAGFWVIVCGDLGLQANQPNVEVFLNAALVWGLFATFVSWTRHTEDESENAARFSGETSSLLLAGVCFGVATLYKQVAVAVPIFLGLAYLLARRMHNRHGWNLRAPVLLVAPGIVFWLVTGLYFAARGHFEDFYYAMFVIPRIYSVESLGVTPSWRNFFPAETYFLLPLFFLGMAGVIFVPKQPAKWFVLIAYTLAAFVAIVLPQHFYPHYFQLYLPIACVWGAVGIHALWHHSARNLWRGAVLGAAAIVSSLLCFVQVPHYFLTPEQWSYAKYGTLFIQTRQLAEELDSKLGPNETLYQYGIDAGFNFFSGRRLPSGVVCCLPLFRGPKAAEFNERVIRSLEAAPPKFVVINTNFPPCPIWKWIDQHYERVKWEGIFIILVRRGEKY